MADYRDQNIKLWSDGVTALAAYDFEDVVRLHTEAGIVDEETLTDELWEPLADGQEWTVHLHPWSPVPAIAKVEEVEPVGDGWTRRVTAPAWAWANCGAAQGRDWSARFISSTEW